MKRVDMETTEGDKGRQGARVTEQRLKETSANLSRNNAMLFISLSWHFVRELQQPELTSVAER